MQGHMNLTFDHNCLIDLELNEGQAEALKFLVDKHNSEKINISVSAISASERLLGNTYAQNFSEFKQRVSHLFQRQVIILKPITYYGVGYYDWCIYNDEGGPLSQLEKKIHHVLFPNTKFKWSDHAHSNNVDPNEASDNQDSIWQTWRNKKCDTLTMWCHIYYGNNIFVTMDKNFHKASKKTSLISLGAEQVMYPDEVSMPLQ